MSDIRVRPARSAEYDTIGEITVAAWVIDDLIDPASPYIVELRDAADRATNAELLVADLAGDLAGTVTYCPPGSTYREVAAGGGEAEFRMLAVTPAARGNGVAAALVQECVDRAAEAGLTVVRLSTQPAMHAAHRIYERFGFVRTPDHDWAPVPGVDLLTYELRLPGGQALA